MARGCRVRTVRRCKKVWHESLAKFYSTAGAAAGVGYCDCNQQHKELQLCIKLMPCTTRLHLMATGCHHLRHRNCCTYVCALFNDLVVQMQLSSCADTMKIFSRDKFEQAGTTAVTTGRYQKETPHPKSHVNALAQTGSKQPTSTPKEHPAQAPTGSAQPHTLIYARMHTSTHTSTTLPQPAPDGCTHGRQHGMHAQGRKYASRT